MDLLDRRLLVVTGKGGVGKTTVAAALALLGAQRGKRTLACEVDAKGDLSGAFEVGPVGFVPTEIHKGLSLMAMDTEASLREYLALNLRVPLVARLGPLARAFDFVATAAPGVREILVVGKLCYEVRERRYDLVVADASASGHVVGQLAAPQAINELVRVGLVRQQTGWMLEILSDPATTAAVVVTTPEEMPVAETVELARRLEAETTVALGAVVANRVLPELFSRREERLFTALCEPGHTEALSRALGGDAEPLLAAARLAVRMRRTRAGHLAALRRGIPSEVPLLYVPELFSRSHGLRAVRKIATALGAELGY